jgi:hypothetical protein
MAEVISGFVFVLTNWMIYKRSALLFMSLFSIIFVFGWMLISVIYIDLHKNIYAVELFKNIGGKAYSLQLAFVYFVFGISTLLVFTRRRLHRLSKYLHFFSRRIVKLNFLMFSRIPIILLFIFIIYLYTEMFKYPIPFFAGIERGWYRLNYNNISLNFLYSYKDFISLFIGVIFLYEFKRKGKYKGIILFLYGALLIYFILVGNKFSTLFFSLCFFIIPLSLNFVTSGFLKNKRKAVVFKVIIWMVIFVILIFVAVYNYFFEFKSWDIEEIKSRIKHRIFIQQGQVWWSTADRILEKNNWNPQEAFNRVFTEPIYSKNSNTSLHYLMYKEVGVKRVLNLIKSGSGYTGAFPAILLELFGPVGIYFAVFVFALILLNLLYLFLWVVARYHYLSIFFLAFVLQPWIYMFLGGKIHYFTMPMFILKCGLMVIAIIFDQILINLHFEKNKRTLSI